MLISDFTKIHHTTKETVRHYVALGLLLPERHGRNYWYTATDEDDFEEVRGLQELGFSLAAISKIRAMHDTHCGTAEQWRFNAHLINQELAKIDLELTQLQSRRANLHRLQEQLQVNLDRLAD
jgi:DNA-binding transcriptional MerR regulator